MRINIIRPPLETHQHPWLDAFADGLKRHGITPTVSGLPKAKDCELAVFWGHRFKDVINHQRGTGGCYLALERGYIGDREESASISINGLHGKSLPLPPEHKPADRFARYQHMKKPWRTCGEYVVVIGQVLGDASIDGVNIYEWYRSMFKCLRNVKDAPLGFRPHPLARQAGGHGEDKLFTGPLQDTLEIARAIITYNSNTAVESLLFGTPTVTLDQGSIAWPVTGHIASDDPPRMERQWWLNDLAYRQWGLGEIRKGEAWEYLGGAYEN